jgi:hypothetical protein
MSEFPDKLAVVVALLIPLVLGCYLLILFVGWVARVA